MVNTVIVCVWDLNTSSNHSHDAKHLHHDGRSEVAKDHRCHEDAEGAAEEKTDDAVDLSQEFRANQLSKHLERIERELNTADGWGKVRFHVGVLTSLTQRLLRGHSHWENSQVNAKGDLLAILHSEQVEAIIVTSEFNLCTRRHLLLKEGFVVLLVHNHRLLGQANILEHLFKIKRPLANVVIGLKQVKVPCLHHEE